MKMGGYFIRKYQTVNICPDIIPPPLQNAGDHTQYGVEYHGVLDKYRAEQLLGGQDGAYLVRDTPKGASILSFM